MSLEPDSAGLGVLVGERLHFQGVVFGPEAALVTELESLLIRL